MDDLPSSFFMEALSRFCGQFHEERSNRWKKVEIKISVASRHFWKRTIPKTPQNHAGSDESLI